MCASSLTLSAPLFRNTGNEIPSSAGRYVWARVNSIAQALDPEGGRQVWLVRYVNHQRGLDSLRTRLIEHPRASEPWLRSSSPLRATHWPLYSRPCALSHSCSGIRPEFAPGAGTSVIVKRTCCFSCSDKGSSGRKSPSSNIASACWVTISFYRGKLGSSWEVSDRALGG